MSCRIGNEVYAEFVDEIDCLREKIENLQIEANETREKTLNEVVETLRKKFGVSDERWSTTFYQQIVAKIVETVEDLY